MKKNALLLIAFFLLQHVFVMAQKTAATKTTATSTVSKKDLESLPFAKGKWEFDVAREELNFTHQNIKANGVHQGNQTLSGLTLGTNYYVANHIGVGLQLTTNWNTYNNSSSKQNVDSWMAYANFTYGTSLSDQIGFYARAGVGLGSTVNKTVYNNSSITTSKTTGNLFGYKVDLGLPIRLGNEPVYLTPEIGYRYKKDDFTGGSSEDDRFCFGLDFETYLFCHEMQCNSHLGYPFSANAYNQGSSYFGVTTRGNLNFGTLDSKFDNPAFLPTKEKYTDIDLQANYMYYILPNLAFGADLDFSHSKLKFPPGSATETSTGFSAMPMLELNMPVTDKGWRNLFVRSGYGFGSSNDKDVLAASTATYKYSSTEFCAGLGYNFFFHKGLAFTPIFEYDMSTMKNKTTDVKTDYSGPEVGFGVRKFFK